MTITDKYTTFDPYDISNFGKYLTKNQIDNLVNQNIHTLIYKYNDSVTFDKLLSTMFMYRIGYNKTELLNDSGMWCNISGIIYEDNKYKAY